VGARFWFAIGSAWIVPPLSVGRNMVLFSFLSYLDAP